MAEISLSDEVQRLIEREVAAGRAASPAAFVEGAVLRVLEADREQEAHLRRLVDEGVASGESDEDPNVFFDRLEAKHGAPRQTP